MNGRYSRVERVDWVVVGGEAVLFESATGQLFELDHWATSIWTALDGADTIDTIARAIAAGVDAPADSVRRDVEHFCITLCDQGLIERAAKGGTGRSGGGGQDGGARGGSDHRVGDGHPQ
jgi:hypothetical protein